MRRFDGVAIGNILQGMGVWKRKSVEVEEKWDSWWGRCKIHWKTSHGLDSAGCGIKFIELSPTITINY